MSKDAVRSNFLGSLAKDGAIASIKILGHTGKSIVAIIEQFATDRSKVGITSDIGVQLLLRDRGVEAPRRRAMISLAEKGVADLTRKFGWLNIEVRHYSAIQTLRGTIIVRGDGSKDALFSAYHWILPGDSASKGENLQGVRTTAVEWSKRLHVRKGMRGSEDTRLLGILENWFDYYWGPGIIHTIAFDFDDTIVDTYIDKIRAWIDAVERTLASYPNWRSHFDQEFIDSFINSSSQRFVLFKKLVDELPGNTEIISKIVSSTAAFAEDGKYIDVGEYVDRIRSDFRRTSLFPNNMTLRQLQRHLRKKVFKGVRRTLVDLHRRGYALAVASLTDEERIEKTLRLVDIPFVSTVLGRTEYQDRELSKYLSENIFLIRKIASLAGIPVTRVLYIGDHRKDELAAAEIGASFIQSLMMSEVIPSEKSDTLRFNHYSQLVTTIEKAEGRLRALESIPHVTKTF